MTDTVHNGSHERRTVKTAKILFDYRLFLKKNAALYTVET